MQIATARHILVDSEEEAQDLKNQIAGGASFSDLAYQHSNCPSGKEGGSLGEFGPGLMVKEFDEIVFNEEVNIIHGPIRTIFGFHLIEILSRE